MSELTRAQKARLGFFLLFAAGLLAIVVVVKVGQSLFDQRDVYRVRVRGGVGSLDRGSAVTFNGIVVGRVEQVAIDPADVAVVAIDLSLAQGTPIPEDTRATVGMRGITGLKYVALDGGTNGARLRQPGEEIPPGRSLLDEIEQRAVGIAAKLEGVLDDVHAAMYGAGADHLQGTLASVQRTTEALEWALVTNAPKVAGLLERADEAIVELKGMMAEARVTAVALRETAMTTNAAMSAFDATVTSFGETTRRVGANVDRAMLQVDPLMSKISTALGRAGTDLRTALDEIVQGFDSVGALADMLRADPSSIILGRSAKERKLP